MFYHEVGCTWTASRDTCEISYAPEATIEMDWNGGFQLLKKAQGFTKDITFPIINIGLISGSVLFKQGGKYLLQGLSKAIGDVIRREVCRVGFDQQNPKPETRNRLLKLVSNCENRNPKPETDSAWRLTSPRADRNPKPETDSKDLPSPGPIETRNPKPETDSEYLTSPVPIETRNPKPETDSESGFQSTKPETRNPKPTAKVGFKRWNPKPETRNPKPTAKVGFNRRNPKPETRNPKPTLIRLLGGSPDRNSAIGYTYHWCWSYWDWVQFLCGLET